MIYYEIRVIPIKEDTSLKALKSQTSEGKSSSIQTKNLYASYYSYFLKLFGEDLVWK